jgi:hypothetical protein
MSGTPVLLVIFNRAELARQVVDALRVVRPRTLLVAADGPRSSAESALCEQARRVIDEVDWPCEILRDFSATNLGCGIRIATAITWAMKRCEELIVLEDDCVPAPGFFTFCEEMLERYRQDVRVMHIGGFGFEPPGMDTGASYFFTKYTIASGGFATWRRAWTHFDWALSDWHGMKGSGLIDRWCGDSLERKMWLDIGERMHAGAPDVWDYQWTLACWRQGGLSVLPTVPLLRAIGFGASATHAKTPIPFLMRPFGSLPRPLVHPIEVRANAAADSQLFEINMGGAELRRQLAARALPARAKARFRRTFPRTANWIRRFVWPSS